MNCSDVLNFTYANDSVKANLSEEIASLECTFDMLAYILIYDPNDPLVKYPNVLYVSNASETIKESFREGLFNMTLNKDIVTLECNGADNLELGISYAGSECGYIVCPYVPPQNQSPL